MPNKDEKLERAGKKGLVSGLILGTIRRGSPTGSRLARPLAYGAGGYLAGKALHLAAKRLIKPNDASVALTKQASNDSDKSKLAEGSKAIAGGALAYNAGKGVSQRVLGYHNIYHGSSKENVESILKNGLDPKRGGTGGATDAAIKPGTGLYRRYKENSAGQVHFTKHKGMADSFSGAIGSKRPPEDKIKDALKGFFTGIHNGHTHSAVMSDSHYRSSKIDKDASPIKYMAAKTHHGIKPEQIKGSKAYKGIRSVVNKNTLRRYYSDEAGRYRAGRGLALASIAALAGKYAYDHGKNALGLDKKAGALLSKAYMAYHEE